MKSRLAISLSWIAGYVNVITFMVCGVVISHVTGNVTHFGELGAELHWHAAGYFAYLILAFLAGAVASAFMTEGAERRGYSSRYLLPMTVEALALTALGVWVAWRVPYILSHPTEAGKFVDAYWMTGVASFAMGLQNATITRISGAVVRTTHLTGVVTDLGLEGVQFLQWYWDKTRSRSWNRRGQSWNRRGRALRVSRRHPSARRIVLLLSIVASFGFGVVAGTFVFKLVPTFALLAPVVFLLWIVFVDYTKPIAAVSELDLLSDPELEGYGIVKALLPPDMGICRLSYHRKDAMHHAPNFQAWANRLPSHWRVIVLAVNPLTHFDRESVEDLKLAVQSLKSQRKRLVVGGVSPAQFKLLHTMGLTQILDSDDICPDLEFAIARGMSLAYDVLPRPAGVG